MLSFAFYWFLLHKFKFLCEICFWCLAVVWCGRINYNAKWSKHLTEWDFCDLHTAHSPSFPLSGFSPLMSSHNKCKLKLIELSFSTCFGAHCECYAAHIGVRWIGRKTSDGEHNEIWRKEYELIVIIIQLIYPPKLSQLFFAHSPKTSLKKATHLILIVWTS